jgi:hypothetical protein
MHCQTIQNRILALPDPRFVPEGLREHLAACAGCRDWARQAARLEGLLEQLPAPPAPQNKKERLIEELVANEPLILRPLAAPRPSPESTSARELLSRYRTLAAGLAAALLVALGGIWLFNRPGSPEVARATGPAPRYPFLDKVSQRYVALAKAETPTRKLDDLSGLAEDISTEAQSLSRVANEKELGELASMFQKVVADGIVKQADKMNVPNVGIREWNERKSRCEAVAAKLSEVAKQADDLAGKVPPQAKEAIAKIARSARDGETRLKWPATPAP